MQLGHIPSGQSMIWPDKGRLSPGRPPGRQKTAVSGHFTCVSCTSNDPD